jgi:DNA helicase-2/ATP-dependent DNA helicase PcrA
MMRAGGNFSAYGRSYGRSGRIGEDFEDVPPRPSAASRRPGMPVRGYAPVIAAEDESQDTPVFAPGVRVKHRKFGSGTIAEVVGSGRDAKVKVDFDDAAIGRKTLVIAQANLERGDD